MDAPKKIPRQSGASASGTRRNPKEDRNDARRLTIQTRQHDTCVITFNENSATDKTPEQRTKNLTIVQSPSHPAKSIRTKHTIAAPLVRSIRRRQRRLVIQTQPRILVLPPLTPRREQAEQRLRARLFLRGRVPSRPGRLGVRGCGGQSRGRRVIARARAYGT